jgi:hypothetical protein
MIKRVLILDIADEIAGRQKLGLQLILALGLKG